MSPEVFKILVATFSIWGVAVAIKAARALHRNTPYEFEMWDGGMLRKGKRIDKMGKIIKVAVGVLMAAGCIALFAGWIPLQSGSYALMFVAIVSVVSDFVTVEKSD